MPNSSCLCIRLRFNHVVAIVALASSMKETNVRVKVEATDCDSDWDSDSKAQRSLLEPGLLSIRAVSGEEAPAMAEYESEDEGKVLALTFWISTVWCGGSGASMPFE